MNKSVCIIILNWNGSRDTIECVESCLRLDYSPFEIVLVDNGSEDGSEELLRKAFPGLKLLQTGANLGYAGGNNAGIRYALTKNVDYVWLLNNDAVADSNALGPLVAHAEKDPSIGMAGSKIRSQSDPAVLLYAGGRLDSGTGNTEHVGYGCVDKGQFDHPSDTGYITGCSLLVKQRVLEDIGLMNEDYFLYYEETDWCARATGKGYRLAYVPESVVFHKESVSVRKVGGVMNYYLTRNRLYFIGRNGASPNWFSRFAGDFRALLRCIRRRETLGARCILKAYRHWIAGYMGPVDNPVKPGAGNAEARARQPHGRSTLCGKNH